ncbi:MAG: mandelate racemase/muconate lactonizing enzyme family protein [Variibacter sp.]|nr:mandelate racemase/muconate lactonizing enzyme family protein [Variibacter sp.]
MIVCGRRASMRAKRRREGVIKIVSIEDLHADGGWRNHSFLKITADDGLVGWSEYNEGRATPGLTLAIRRLGEGLIGQDPRQVGVIGAALAAATRITAGGMAAQAAAALENACLDLKAKALGVPVYELFGGALRTTLPAYWSQCGTLRARHAEVFEGHGVPPLRSLDDVTALGREVAARGFKALKTNVLLFEDGRAANYQPGWGAGRGHPERNLDDRLLAAITDLLAAFRQGAGDGVRLMLDLNTNFTVEAVRGIAHALESFRPLWLEVDLYEPAMLASIRQATTVPIASLETIYGRRAVKPFLDRCAVDVMIVDPTWNGFVEATRMAALAELYEMNVAPHNYFGPLSTVMAAQFGAVIPNFRIMELVVDEAPWLPHLVTRPPVIENGELLVSDAPGWGAGIDETVVRQHPPRAVGGATWMLDYHRRVQ